MGETEAIKRPLDDPLPWMLADPRRLHERTVRDGVQWIRIVDAAAALEQRSYAEPGQSGWRSGSEKDGHCPWNENQDLLRARRLCSRRAPPSERPASPLT